MRKPRKPLRRQSTKRAAQVREYAKVRPVFLEASLFCFKCSQPIPLSERTIHHYFGRVHALLCWVPGFRMACLPCHQWIETHRNDAVKLGLRASNKLFNRPSLAMAFINSQE